MHDLGKSPFLMGMVAALVATLSLGVFAAEAGDLINGYVPVEYGKQLDKLKRHLKRRNNFKCPKSEIPVYTGEKIICSSEEPPAPNIVYRIGEFGQMEADVWDTTAFYALNGGEFNAGTGMGELRFTQGKPAEITYAFVNADILALSIKWGLPGSVPSVFSGRLEVDTPGIYSGDLFDDFENTVSFDPGIQVFLGP